MENPGLATVYRPLRHDEDPRSASSWHIFWDNEVLPFKGIFSAPSESYAKKMLGSHRGCVIPIHVDFAHERVVVAFPSSFSGYEMCNLADYLDFRQHHQISNINAKPKNVWYHNDDRDPKNYTIVILLPPQAQLSCVIVLSNVNQWINIGGTSRNTSDDS